METSENIPNHQENRSNVDWVEKQRGDFKLVAMKFPTESIYTYPEYEDLVWRHLFEGKELKDILDKEDLLSMFGNSNHAYGDIKWLEMAHRYYPENMESFYEEFEKSLKNRRLGDIIAGIATEKDPNEFNCDEKNWWFELLDKKMLEDNQQYYQHDISLKYNADIIKNVTKLFLKYAPPIDSKKPNSSTNTINKNWELDDYLLNEELKKRYSEEIPIIGKGLKEISERVHDNPAESLNEYLSSLPAYNAGKQAYWIGKYVRKYKEQLNKDELIKIVQQNKHLGEFDKEPITQAIKEAFEN